MAQSTSSPAAGVRAEERGRRLPSFDELPAVIRLPALIVVCVVSFAFMAFVAVVAVVVYLCLAILFIVGCGVFLGPAFGFLALLLVLWFTAQAFVS